jgi:hypothetical protein
MVISVHTGSGMGTSGNITILMRREPGSGSPETDVGGAWIPEKKMYIVIRIYVKKFDFQNNLNNLDIKDLSNNVC